MQKYLFSEEYSVGICEIPSCLLSYQMLPSVTYQNAKRTFSSQAHLSVYVYISSLSPICNRNTFLPRVSLTLEPLLPPLSFSLSLICPPSHLCLLRPSSLTYQFHSTCVVAAVFTATSLRNLTTSSSY